MNSTPARSRAGDNGAPLVQWTRRESNPHCQHARLASFRWTTGPIQLGEWGSNPRSPASKAGGLPLSYPLNEWTAGESHPDFRLATAASSCSTTSPKRSGRGLNPVFRAYQGGVRPQHFQTIELRRPDLNRRGNGL